MSEIRLIDEKTDLQKVLHPLSWDIMIKGEPYKGFFAYDNDGEYNHTIGGRYDYVWACPRNEEPTFENLIEFDGEPCEWGFSAMASNSIRTKYDEVRCNSKCVIEILRNGDVFDSFVTRDAYFGVAKAQVKITEYQEHPLELNTYEFDKKCVGRKIRYKGIPSIITRFVWGQASIIIKPINQEDVDEFFSDIHKTHDEYMEDYFDECKNDGCLKVDINSQFIWWFEN